MGEVEAKWDADYLPIGQSWRRNWSRLTPFFDYPAEILKLIYTTNAIELVNMGQRKLNKNHAFGGKYLEPVPNVRIVNTDIFDAPNLPGQMITTIAFKAVSCGTELTAVQQGIPAMIPVEACYLGWQQTVQLLAQLVEAEVAA